MALKTKDGKKTDFKKILIYVSFYVLTLFLRFRFHVSNVHF